MQTPLVVIPGNFTAVAYRDQVLRPHVCRDFLTQNNVLVFNWPPYCLDLSLIEHLWDQLDRRVRERINVPYTVAQLTQALIQEWNDMISLKGQ